VSASPVPRITAESNRVEAFSDGVLAIAITLLVLDLHSADRRGDVGHGIVSQWPTYIAYVASFAYIGVVWVNHHSLFNRIERVDSGLLWCNLALLLPISVLPFPTAQLASAMDDGTHDDKVYALLLYAGVSVAMAATWLIVFSYLVRHPALVRSDVPDGFFTMERNRSFFGIIGSVVPVLIGLFSPIIALVVLVVIPVFYALTAEGLLTRRPGPAGA
jgi:uncharacterized membrane protein